MNDIQIKILKEAASLQQDKFGNLGTVWAKWENGFQNLKLPCLKDKPYANIKSEIVAPLLKRYFEQVDTKGELFRLTAAGLKAIAEAENSTEESCVSDKGVK